MATLDKRGWHIYARLVCEHQQLAECARPQWIRVMVLWHPALGDMLSSKILNFLYWAFPGLFGGRALMCGSCHMVAYQSKLALVFSQFMAVLFGLQEGDADAILMNDEDVRQLSDKVLEELHAEDV